MELLCLITALSGVLIGLVSFIISCSAERVRVEGKGRPSPELGAIAKSQEKLADFLFWMSFIVLLLGVLFAIFC